MTSHCSPRLRIRGRGRAEALRARAGHGAALAFAAVLLALSAVPAQAAATTGACATRELVIWLDTQGSGTAGSSFYTVELTNLSKRACTLSGYPKVAAVDLGGHRLGRASRRLASPVRTVTLAHGATASFALQVTDVGNYSASACGPVTAAGLRVFPPGQSASKVVPFPFEACSRSGPRFLSAQAVKAQA